MTTETTPKPQHPPLEPATEGQVLSGAEILVQSLMRAGVDVAFGYPGGAIMDTFHFLNRSPIEFILSRHEQGATHMADGYARVTGKAGVVIVTSGPGATNTITGIATANMDSVPLVVITGQVPTTMVGNDAFQEADVVGITRPISKHNYLINDVRDVARVVREAFHIATTGRPGPVVIDFPKDVQQAQTAFHWPESVDIRGYRPDRLEKKISPSHPMVQKAAKAIMRAKRPVLYVGGGAVIAGASEEVTALARRCQIPVTTTLTGLGAFPEDDPLSLQMLGMHGTEYANYAVDQCDTIIAVGARFDDRVTGKIAEFMPQCECVIHIDIDPSSISKNIQVDIPITGDAKACLAALLELVEPTERSEWAEQVLAWKKHHPLREEFGDDEIHPQRVISAIDEIAGPDKITVTDVGQHQMWACHFITHLRPRSWLSSGGLGTMGYGLPAAIGAKVAAPDRAVWCISGDGGIQMNMQEMTTAALNEIAVKVAVLNNQYLGMVRQWQQLFYGRNYSYTCLRRRSICEKVCRDPGSGKCQAYLPNIVAMAEACGWQAQRVERRAGIRDAIQWAEETPGPVLLEFSVHREDNVWPMIPAGQGVKKMMRGMELI
ncbi:biosynthetic-type acetolactate synthase large subunit [Candidatus Sumerlaeota bacterium]|nr:biosynthetic-type acetolactate synthase large subunit [Candidatus Sumerlaeota bacterium]